MKKALIIIIVFFTACKKNTSSIVAEFPNEIGNHWRYQYTPTGLPASFIDVDIVGTRTLPNNEIAKIWVYKYQSYTDTNYVVFDGQAAKIYLNPCRTCTALLLNEKMRYLFPLQVGSSWYPTPPFGDTTKVLANTTITVPAGVFKNTFELSKKRNYAVNAWINNLVWFTPNVGMIKLNQGEFDLGPVLGNGTWQLVDYHLK